MPSAGRRPSRRARGAATAAAGGGGAKTATPTSTRLRELATRMSAAGRRLRRLAAAPGGASRAAPSVVCPAGTVEYDATKPTCAPACPVNFFVEAGTACLRSVVLPSVASSNPEGGAPTTSVACPSGTDPMASPNQGTCLPACPSYTTEEAGTAATIKLICTKNAEWIVAGTFLNGAAADQEDLADDVGASGESLVAMLKKLGSLCLQLVLGYLLIGAVLYVWGAALAKMEAPTTAVPVPPAALRPPPLPAARAAA